MNERLYNGTVDRLRSPERVERLEVEKVTEVCLQTVPAKTLLDVGTGSGLFAEAFYRKNVSITGIDVNTDMIKAAAGYLPKCTFKIAEAEKIPFENNSFDITFFGVVFHEVSDYKKALSEAKRVSKKAVFILEWEYKTQEFGPPLEHRIKPEFMQELSVELNFSGFEIIRMKNLVLYKFEI